MREVREWSGERHQSFDKPVEQRRREFVLGVATVAVLGAAAIGVVVTSGGDDAADETIVSSDQTAAGAELVQDARDILAATANDDEPFVEMVDVELAGITDPDPESSEGAITRADGGCTIGALSLRLGASGEGVECLQGALAEAGHYDGAITGDFDQATFDAVQSYQLAEDLFVDGVVGRESALALEIWPDEESLVVRTPAPPPGATDLWGVELSPVASAGDDAPPLPDNSGTGYRVVYDRAGQRVWAVDGNERIIRSWLVSGSTYSNELPGTHYVYSRSEVSTAWNGKAYLPLMIRYLKTERGNIGFHGIPTKVTTGEVYQTTEELGTRLSGGCQRQHNTDAAFLWGFADVGTKVVVT
ncbi:MAG: peptidoglycan-binding protein [Ilumatobacter sp.]|uniref:L,D-transpeptidase family protein n=1 Tax=Ilumatobacter sp. TaxID=1967498 RepID=UPI00391B1701